jgi:dTDP-4-dehydrorhamnose 3,5-epimerase
MCRSIQPLHNYDPATGDDEIEAAALQYVRKVSGMRRPARANQAAFDRAVGQEVRFVQDNHSRSARGVLRGIHYQDLTAPMAKLIRCSVGCIFDVAVDLRVGSPTFAQWVALELSAQNMKQVLVPVGFGHAFLTLSDVAEVQYKSTSYYTPAAEAALAWNDPDIAVAWPMSSALIISARDQRAMSLKQYLDNPAFVYGRDQGPGTRG